MVPAAATAPAFIPVGLFMLSPIEDIDFNDYTEAIPAFLTLIIMPLSYSIAEGIVFGMLSYFIFRGDQLMVRMRMRLTCSSSWFSIKS